MDGTLPPETAMLPKLESLILQNNLIRGTIPEYLGEISLLNTLILSGNPLEGSIPEIVLQNTPLLGTIHLSRTNLNGTIPTELAALPITDLRLDENALTGPIPAALGTISGLRKLCTCILLFTAAMRCLTQTHIIHPLHTQAFWNCNSTC